MNTLMPNTTTATEIQRNYKKVARRAKNLGEPLIILSNNSPEGVYLDYETFKNLIKNKVLQEKTSKLSELSGIWSKKEADDFDATIDSSFEQVDIEKWL